MTVQDTAQAGDIARETRLFRLRGLDIATIAAICVATLIGLARVGYTVLSGITGYPALTRDDVYALLSSAGQWVFYGAGVLFVGWLWRARKNLDVLGGLPATTYGAGWAIGGWFLPIANLFIPYLLVAQVIRASTTSRAHVWLVRGWWAGVIGQVLGLAVFVTENWVPFFVAGAVLWAMAGGCLVAIVSAVTAGQHSKMDTRLT